jgi:hypothetical protein
MNILPLLSTKPENTKPYKDWLKTCGINDVVDEDYTMRIWEGWLFKSNRFGRKTPDKLLHKAYSKQCYLKQLDIDNDEDRSSDVNLQIMGYKDRHIYKDVAPVTISEHSVRRWWEHTQTKPDILSWTEYGCQAFLKNLVKPDTTELYHPKALLIGYATGYSVSRILMNIDTKDHIKVPGVGFRITTVIPADILNDSQRYRWYKLKETIE